MILGCYAQFVSCRQRFVFTFSRLELRIYGFEKRPGGLLGTVISVAFW